MLMTCTMLYKPVFWFIVPLFLLQLREALSAAEASRVAAETRSVSLEEEVVQAKEKLKETQQV